MLRKVLKQAGGPRQEKGSLPLRLGRRGAACLLALLLLTGCASRQDPLPQPAAPKEQELQLTTLTDEAKNFSTQVPATWASEQGDGFYRYTDPATGTMLTIYIEAYTPNVHNIGASEIQARAENAGLSAVSFSKPAGDRFSYVCSGGDTSDSIQEEDYVYFNYEYIYTFAYQAEKKYQAVFEDYFKAAVDDFSLLAEAKTISENFAGYYNASAGVYFEYPYFWSVDTFSTGFSVTSPDTQTTITVDFVGPMDGFSQMTELEYQSLMRSSIQNISLLNYSNSGTQIGAELTFSQGDTRYYVRNYLLDRTSYVLNLTFVAATNYTETDYPAFQTMLDSLTWEETA